MRQENRVISERAGYLLIAPATALIGGYHLWIAATGLRSGAVSVFTRGKSALAVRATEPGFFWANVAGRLALAALLIGVAVAAVRSARALRDQA